MVRWRRGEEEQGEEPRSLEGENHCLEEQEVAQYTQLVVCMHLQEAGATAFAIAIDLPPVGESRS